MLAQAEHDPMAAAVCVTPNARLARRVAAALDEQLAALPRRAIAARALATFGAIVVVRSLAEAVDVANRLAPEHLELAVRTPRRWAAAIRHAGAIFLGQDAPEAFGDYVAGPNHVLPTGGTARFASPLGVYDFVKRTSMIEATPRTLARLGPAIVRLARLEGLDAHGRAVERRLAAQGGGR
jgi:histidinol dehydrogenase